jgi:hypothetical protein
MMPRADQKDGIGEFPMRTGVWKTLRARESGVARGAVRHKCVKALRLRGLLGAKKGFRR